MWQRSRSPFNLWQSASACVEAAEISVCPVNQPKSKAYIFFSQKVSFFVAPAWQPHFPSSTLCYFPFSFML
jgi:hypothetical protein